MNFVGRVFNSVSGLYNEMDLGYVCGANDVIVFKNGDRLRSTGFYARFGHVKKGDKTPREVILTVNERVVDLDTRLDDKGNVFFTFHGSPSFSAESPEYSTDTENRTVKSLIESPSNYTYLLSRYNDVSSCLLQRKYLFSDSLYRKVIPSKIMEAFSAGITENFLGSDTVVVGLYLSDPEKPEFLLPFCLFSELYFCTEGRDKEETDRSAANYLVKQLLRKRAKPEQKYFMGKREVFLPESYLKKMCLSPGANKSVYRLSGTPIILTCTVFLWESTDKIVISDIDGTITKSDLMGYIYNAIGKDWTHKGVAALYNRITDNGYKMVYISSRPIGHIGLTKAYLDRVEQDKKRLPKGPVILFPGPLMSAVYREIVFGPEEFKISTISDIKSLLSHGEIFSGFGNKESDYIAYDLCDINTHRIFIVSTTGEVVTGKKGLVRLTHKTLLEMCDGIFPPITTLSLSPMQRYSGR